MGDAPVEPAQLGFECTRDVALGGFAVIGGGRSVCTGRTPVEDLQCPSQGLLLTVLQTTTTSRCSYNELLRTFFNAQEDTV